MPGDVAGGVVDDLFAEAIEEAVEEDVGDDRERCRERRDRAALAVAQQVGVRLISVQKVTVRIASNGAGVPA